MEIIQLQSKKAVLSYLAGQGFKIKKSALYQHVKEGRLRPEADGTFTIKDVDKYAKLFLRRLDGAQAAGRSMEAMQERRLRAETAKLESQARHWDIRARAAAGQVIEKTRVDLELAGRAILLKAALENFIRTETPELIRISGGDPLKSKAVIDYMNTAAAEWLNEYSRKVEWDIIIEPDPDDPDILKATVTRADPRRPDNDSEEDNEMENDATL